MDASEQWRMSNECYVCHQYRYTTVFYSQGENPGLTEIKDAEAVRECMNLGFKEKDEIAPVIAGTVILNGGFSKKLRMMRADLFTLLSIC